MIRRHVLECAPRLCAGALVCAVALSPHDGFGQSTPNGDGRADGARVEALSVASVIGSLRASYRERLPWAEMIELSAGVDSRGRSEIVGVWADGQSHAALTFGDLIVNLTDERINVAHALDVGSFAIAWNRGDEPAETTGDEDKGMGAEAEADDDEAAPAAVARLRRSLPPVYDLPLHLAFSDDADLSDPVPFTRDVSWQSVEQIEAGRVVLRGEFAMGTVEIEADDDPWRVRSFRVAYADGKRVLLAEHRPVRSQRRLAYEQWMFDTSRLTMLDRLNMLRARPGDVIPGKQLPDRLGLQDAARVLDDDPDRPAGLLPRTPDAPDGPAGLLLFTDEAQPASVQTAFDEMRTAGLPVLPVAVVEPRQGETDPRERLAACRAMLDEGPLAFSLSEARSLRRFLITGEAALVLYDEQGIVRVIVFVKQTDEARSLPERIASALETLRGVGSAEGESDEADVGPQGPPVPVDEQG